MDHGRLLKKIFESKSEGKRRMERPRLKWLEDVEMGLSELVIKDSDIRQ
jgi:hypothetical protein